MGKTQLEVGAVRIRNGWTVRAVALALMAWAWIVPALPARAAGTEWQTYLKEDFSGEESMFYTGQAGEAFYSIDDKGRYIINGLDTDSDSLSALTDSLYYYYLEAKCELVSSDAENLAFVGLVFHYKKAEDGTLSYYVFYMYGDGYYGAKRVVGEQVDIALPLTKSDLIDVGATNSLAVEAQGSRFDLFINGKHVDGFTDLKLDGGGFGFYISKRSEGAFDDFVVKVEKRATGQEPPDEPNAADDEASSTFNKYAPPYIPKDPKRPVYPWEVGVDKSKKGKKKAAEKGEYEQQPQVEEGQDGDASASGDEPEAKQEPAKPHVEPAKNKKADGGKEDKPQAKPKAKPPAKPEDKQPGADKSKDKEAQPEPPKAKQPQEDANEDAAQPEPPPDEKGAGVGEAEGEADSAVTAPPALEPPGEQLPPADEELAIAPEPQPAADVDDSAAEASAPASTTTVEAQPEEKPEVQPEEQPKAQPEEQPAAADAPAKKQPSQAKSRVDSNLDGMRARQDDWIDPNSNSPVVEEIRPPAKKVEPAAAPKQEVPKEEQSALKLPSAPDVAAPESNQEDAGSKTGDGDLALLPAAEEPVADTPPAPEIDTKSASAAPAQPETAPEAQPTPEPQPAPELPPGPKSAPEGPADSATDSSPRVLVEQPSQIASADPTKLGDLPALDPKPGARPEPPPESPALTPEPAAPEPAAPLPLAPADVPEPAQPPAAAVDPNLVLLDDDFSRQLWAVAEGQASTYRYFGAAYEIDNLNSTTMALSFQQETLAALKTGCDVEFIDGVSYVGYGLAARFSAKDGSPSYYGLFVCQSGEFMLLRVIDGKETVLQQWTASAALKPNQPNRIELELAGSQIKAYINGELAASVQDDAIARGGYALLAGPGVAARFDNFSLRGIR
jgi:hypothetical protein